MAREFLSSVAGARAEIARIYSALPARSDPDDVANARRTLHFSEFEAEERFERVDGQRKGPDVPDELFRALLAMQKIDVRFFIIQKELAANLVLEMEKIHALCDEALVMASEYLNPRPTCTHTISGMVMVTRDDSCLNSRSNPSSEHAIGVDSFFINKNAFGTSGESEKLGLFELLGLIREYKKHSYVRVLDLKNKLTAEINCLPQSVGKLGSLIIIDVSENHIDSLPMTIADQQYLTKLVLRSNKIVNFPQCITNLGGLQYLDLSSNLLTVLPPAIGRLDKLLELDASNNKLHSIPDQICSLRIMKKLDLQHNKLEELPHSIGQCTSLIELRVDHNELKALPDSVSVMTTLEILTLQGNKIKKLPSMAWFSVLRELDASFNELESVTRDICFGTALVRLNLGNNNPGLQALPDTIGLLQMLEELDIKHNQISALPDSFGRLSKLQVLHLEGNPLQIPPSDIIELGTQAVVHHIAGLVERGLYKDGKSLQRRASFSDIVLCRKSTRNSDR